MGKNSLIMPPKVLKSLINPFEERSKRYFFFKQCQVQLSFASPHKCTLLVLIYLGLFHLSIWKHSTCPGAWINNPVMLGFNILWLTLLGGKEGTSLSVIMSRISSLPWESVIQMWRVQKLSEFCAASKGGRESGQKFREPLQPHSIIDNITEWKN